MVEIEYHIKFPQTERIFNSNDLTFSINKIKSRNLSALYFKMHFYDRSNTKLYTYTSPRWVIDTEYSRRVKSFTIPDGEIDDATSYQIELVSVGIGSENPLFFTECMLNEGGDLVDYFEPNQHQDYSIGFQNSRYVNLYDDEGNFLQIIRPNGGNMSTNIITKNTCTVLAPHFHDEPSTDDPINVFMEFINQKEQRIDVLR